MIKAKVLVAPLLPACCLCPAQEKSISLSPQAMDRSEWAFASSKQFANARSYRRVDSEGNPIAGANYRKSLALN